jgi:hypothetical protein
MDKYRANALSSIFVNDMILTSQNLISHVPFYPSLPGELGINWDTCGKCDYQMFLKSTTFVS